MSDRQYQLVLLGATGFTGKWVAKHLFDQYGSSLSWAMAGRSVDRLNEASEFIGDNKQSIEYVIADSGDENSLRKLAQSAKVVISTVGPYAHYGSLLVKLCAEEGTHYVDLTGEVPWMREMIDTHSATAQASGARIVHSCGFDSIPSDMAVFFAQGESEQRYGAPLKAIRFALLKAKGGMSGGTFASMINVIKEAAADKRVRKLLYNPYSLNPDPSFRGGETPDQSGVVFSKELDKWTAPFLMAGINTRIVRRSNALLDFKYGKDFRYTETMPTGKGASGYLTAKAISTTIKSIAFMSITAIGRSVLGVFIPAQGKGPKIDPENPGFYLIQLNGETANGETMCVRVKGDADPGYGSTSKMLAEAGVCLALDDLGVGGGFWTPASAMGEHLLARLQEKAGLTFDVLSDKSD